MNNMQKQRESNIELLRLFAILGVIILHVNINGGINYSIANKPLLVILMSLESISICAVNIFIMISGYYMWRRSNCNYIKLIMLVLEMLIIALGFEVLGFIKNGTFSFVGLIPNDYFVMFYCTLMIISPFINKAISEMNAKRCALICFILFSLYATFADAFANWFAQNGKNMQDISTITRFGSFNGYTIVNFVMMYVIGAWIHERSQEIEKMKTSVISGILVACIFITTVVSVVKVFENGSFILGIEYSYANPIIVLQSICLFILFTRFNIGTVKWINRLSSASFSIYLIHRRLLSYVIKQKMFEGNWVLALLKYFSIVIILFLAGWLFHELYRPIDKLLEKQLKKIIALNNS